MKKLSWFIVLMMFVSITSMAQRPAAQWGQTPEDWGDFKIGLVCENYPILKERIQQALREGAQLDYRYIYINNGVDPSSNAISWLFSEWTDYVQQSTEIGVKTAFVIYMLQEEGGREGLLSNINNVEFMRNFFNSVKFVAQKANGKKSIFVLEPDTWGYYLQTGLEQGLNVDPTIEPARVNDLGAGFEWLNGMPNSLSGVAQGLIKTVRTFAPDAYCGALMSHWAVSANGKTGPATPKGGDGMVYWNRGDVEYSAQRNAEFGDLLLGNGDRGDFIGVEKNGWSAGRWAKEGINRWYWGDEQNANWVHWVKTLAKTMDMPALGWQISIGHMGLPNENNSYEDTFFPYFYDYPYDFIEAGLIGFLVGKGLADDTDFTNMHGNQLDPNDGDKGDRGWFFEKMKQFDQDRPYLTSSTSITNVASDFLSKIAVIGNEVVALYGNLEVVELFSVDGTSVAKLSIVNNRATINSSIVKNGVYVVKTNLGNTKVVVSNQ